MSSGTPSQALERRIATRVELPRRAVAVAFLDAIPPHMDKFEGSEPSGCSFWRLAAAGKSFYTVPADHCRCAVGAYTHRVPLPPQQEKEAEETLSMMFALGYILPQEVPEIPRLEHSPEAIAYAPLGDAPFAPDVVVFACLSFAAMLLNEAAGRAGIASRAPAMGRPTCMALPAALATGSLVSLGCIGNRTYSGLGPDELYFVVRGKDLPALADALDIIARANQALEQYAAGRRTELATV